MCQLLLCTVGGMLASLHLIPHSMHARRARCIVVYSHRQHISASWLHPSAADAAHAVTLPCTHGCVDHHQLAHLFDVQAGINCSLLM
jgi:hypothetical protein